ncbi:MAG: hypothetical protein ABL912_01885 [Novosphingobium sp.]
MSLFDLNADGQAVTIAEIGPPFRKVTLGGRDRPEQPVTVGGRSRSIQTWYPGTQAASVQHMGTEEAPITLNGWFQDPIAVVAGRGPVAQQALLEGIKIGGGLCQFVWGDRIIRTGRVVETAYAIHKHNKVRYTITFAVDSSNEAIALSPKPSIPGVQAAFAEALDAAVAAAVAAVSAVRVVKTLVGVVK